MTATQALRAEVNDFSVQAAIASFKARQAKVGIIGLGYVGIPLALTAAKAGFSVLGFDIDEPRVQQLNRGESIIKHIPSAAIGEAIAEKRFEATARFDRLHEPDAVLICVPERERTPAILGNGGPGSGGDGYAAGFLSGSEPLVAAFEVRARADCAISSAGPA